MSTSPILLFIAMKHLLISIILLTPFTLSAQQTTDAAEKTTNPIKISGYLQTQFQSAQDKGINSWSGGDFTEFSNSRFMLRRGRIKIEREDKFSNVVFQIDATQDGVKIMDAYIDFHLAQWKDLTFTAGLFNRPFGYSLAYSSSDRAFPERARVFQTVMPRERDLGAMLSYTPHKALPFLTAHVAVVNGTGITAKDFDNKKDIIGSLNFKFDSIANQKLHLGFGASIYKGSVRNDTETYYTPNGNRFTAHTNAINEGRNLARNYVGADLQISYDSDFGTTSFKTEYIAGKQPGLASTSNISGLAATTSFATQPTGNLYVRNFNGYYFWLTQAIANTKLVAIVGYDVYDPNTDINENEIGRAGTYTSSADIKFNTFGYGFTYAINNRLKATIYNEHVNNNGTALADFRRDVKDNVFTTRLQYRW